MGMKIERVETDAVSLVELARKRMCITAAAMTGL